LGVTKSLSIKPLFVELRKNEVLLRHPQCAVVCKAPNAVCNDANALEGLSTHERPLCG
jgi:hypothetical protein